MSQPFDKRILSLAKTLHAAQYFNINQPKNQSLCPNFRANLKEAGAFNFFEE